MIKRRADLSAAVPARGPASTRAAAQGTATARCERVSALERSTRSGTGSATRCGRSSAPLAERVPCGGNRPREVGPRLDGGGPSLLTEDRQKPLCRGMSIVAGATCRSDARRGTRNTVPSIAVFALAKRRRSMAD
jgi:hypothetical protein